MKRCGLLLMLLGAVLLAAEERAQVSGMVRDSSDAALQDAALTVVNADTGIRRSTRSGPAGDYVIGGLPAGMYKITVRKPGFQTVARLNVRLEPAESARLDFRMQVGSVREVVTVEGAPPLMNADDASVGSFTDQQLAADLPLNGRELFTLVDLAPGVVTTPATLGEAGQFSANGQRPNANYFTVDGVSANTGVSGSATPAQFSGGTLPAMTAFGSTQTLSPIDAVLEVRAQTSSFAPEFGRAPGANVGVTTRSGTNELHGSAFYTGRNSALDANDWFANASGLARAPANLNNWGATIGGPVRRDRTFFFAGYEGLRFQGPSTWRSAVPSLASRDAAPANLRPVLDAFPQPTGPDLGLGLSELTVNTSTPSGLDLGSFRVDHALNSRVSLFARYQQVPSRAEAGFSQVENSSFNNVSFTIGASMLAGPAVTGDTRLNFTRTNVSSRWLSTRAGGAAPVDLSSILPHQGTSGPILYGFGIGGVGSLLSGESSGSRQDQWNLTETLAWTASKHALRAGADYNRLLPTRDRPAATLAGTYETLVALLGNQPIAISASQAGPASSVIETLALFAQDTWRVTPGLAVTYGFRWELTPAPAYRLLPSGISLTPTLLPLPGAASAMNLAASSVPIWVTRYAQFAPRAGIAYRLAPATVLRAGWGIFYDANFAVATDPINAFPYNRWQFATSAPSFAAPANASYSGFGYAPDLKLPYTREWNVSLEHAFGSPNVVSASYVGSAARRLLRREATLTPDSLVALTPIATNHGRADFQALELQYRRKLAAGLQGMASYTWSHSIDNGSWDSGIYLPESAAFSDRGSSAFDIRHHLSAGLTWRSPRVRGASALSQISRNWTLSTFVAARSGFPLDVLAAENLLGLGFDDFRRPDLVRGMPLWIADPNLPAGRRINPEAFALPPGSQPGNLGRNALTGFGLGQVDLALDREFSLREESVLQLRVEAFNTTNRAQFADPVSFRNSPSFGQSASLVDLMLGSGTPHSGIAPAFQTGAPRVLQFTVKLRF